MFVSFNMNFIEGVEQSRLLASQVSEEKFDKLKCDAVAAFNSLISKEKEELISIELSPTKDEWEGKLDEYRDTYRIVQYICEKEHMKNIGAISSMSVMQTGSNIRKKIYVMKCFNNGCEFAGTLKCARCKKVFYCNKECQRSDWKMNHKWDCVDDTL